MATPARFLGASAAAGRLGISIKALRLYEQRGFLTPTRTAAGWRIYGPAQLARAQEIVALRSLGFSLAQIGRVLDGDLQSLDAALAAQQAMLDAEMRGTAAAISRLGALRADLAAGARPSLGALAQMLAPDQHRQIAFDLHWPWAGEHFELRDIRRLNHLTGPLGSGKTKLAMRLAETVPGAFFLGLDRLMPDAVSAAARLRDDSLLRSRVDKVLAWMVEDGATVSDALVALLTGLALEGPSMLVVDMLEQGLDAATQTALIAHLRRQRDSKRPVVFLTRSTAILDLDAVGGDETITFCPANHSVPFQVAPYRGAPGYEALASCLATPDVRARTAGVIAWCQATVPG